MIRDVEVDAYKVKGIVQVAEMESRDCAKTRFSRGGLQG
jgi:hypothetical protein